MTIVYELIIKGKTVRRTIKERDKKVAYLIKATLEKLRFKCEILDLN